MAIEEQSRSIHFRRARHHGTTSDHLQALLAQAVRTLKNPANRLEPVDDSGPGRRLINYIASQQGTLCGQLVIFSEGASQLLLRRKAKAVTAGEEAESYPLEALKAETDPDGTQTDFLESMLFFCIRNNNVLVLQSRALRAGALEKHIDWLLRQVSLIDDHSAIYLADQPKVTAASAIKKKGVKKVSIGIPMFEAEAGLTEVKQHAQIKVAGRIMDTLKALLGPEAKELKLEDALNGNITATISLSWSRQTTPEAQDVLDEIAVALRNIDANEVSINLNGGMKVAGDELKLVIPILIKIKDGVVQQTSVFKAMRDAMIQAITDKLIPI